MPIDRHLELEEKWKKMLRRRNIALTVMQKVFWIAVGILLGAGVLWLSGV